MNNIRFALFLVATVFFHQGLVAQQRVISGTVRDLGGVLSGATIHEKGAAKNSTASDADGRFQLVITGNSNTIVVRLMGFAESEADVADVIAMLRLNYERVVERHGLPEDAGEPAAAGARAR